MRPPRQPKITDYVEEGVPLVEPGSDAPVGLSVPEIMLEYGDARSHVRNALPLLPKILGTVVNARRGTIKAARAARRKSGQRQSVPPAVLQGRIEKTAQELGCSSVGFTPVDPRLLFKGHPVLYAGAIVLLMPMAPERMRQAPRPASGREVWRTYYELGRVVNILARHIRAAGYGAQPGPAIGGDANYPLLAEQAGLGRIGRHGMLISPATGPSQRIAVVYTDAPFSRSTSSSQFDWIPDFCDTCGRCVRNCPTDAIHPRPVIGSDGHRHHIDYTKCAVAFSQTMGCSICIRECQFFRIGFDRVRTAHLAGSKRR